MLVKVYAAASQGVNAIQVTIEVNALRGIRFFLVGLPDNAVKESHERIRSALEFNGLKFPSKQIVVNMAPADIRKEGSAYDLPIAIGILAADGVVSAERLGKYMIMGELGLDGGLVPIKGALPITLKAKELRGNCCDKLCLGVSCVVRKELIYTVVFNYVLCCICKGYEDMVLSSMDVI